MPRTGGPALAEAVIFEHQHAYTRATDMYIVMAYIVKAYTRATDMYIVMAYIVMAYTRATGMASVMPIK